VSEPYTDEELEQLRQRIMPRSDGEAYFIGRLLSTIAQRDATITAMRGGVRPAGIIWRRRRTNRWFWRNGIGDRPGLARDPEVEIIPVFRFQQED
jgi:hypothetical protein